MSTGRKTLIALLIIIILGGLGSGGYYLYFKAGEPYTPAIKAVPENAILVFETPNALELTNNLQGRSFWSALTDITQINRIDKVINYMDTLVQNHDEVSDILESKKLYFSMHHDGKNGFSYLFSINLSGISNENKINTLFSEGLGKNFDIIKARHKKISAYKIIHKTSGQIYNYATYKNVFVFSPSIDLLARAIINIDNEGSLEDIPGYQKVMRTAGSKVNGNLYLNYENLAPFIKHLSSSAVSQVMLDRFARTASTDLTLKDQKMFLSGFSFPGDSTEKFLTHLKDIPDDIDLAAYLPSAIAYFINYHFDPDYFAKYRKEFLKANGDYKDYSERKANFDSKYGLATFPSFKNVIDGNTMIAGWTNDRSTKPVSIVVLGLTDREKANAWIRKHARHLRNDIHQLPDGILSLMYGEPFGKLHDAYGILTDNVLLVSDSYENVKKIYGIIDSRRTLNRERYFQAYRENTMTDASVHFYTNLHYAPALLGHYLNDSLFSEIKDYLPVLKDYLFSAEFMPAEELSYTNMCLCYSPGQETRKDYEWMVELDADIDKGPFLVKDHQLNKEKIIVFDELHQMHLIDHLGNVKWSIPLAGNVLSDVYQVDYYKNGKYQYLFNTSEFIYLIDLEGNKVADYPIKLESKASNGLALFHYQDIDSKRILLAGNDNKIYNYYLEGKPVSGWNKPSVGSRVTYPIQHLIAGKKDYIIIPRDNNEVEILNRRGATRINVRDNFENALNSPFYENHTNSKGILITTGVNGNLTYISSSGRTRKTDFGNFSAGHFFRYEDLDNDNSEDFIYIDGNRLVAFDRFKNILIDHRFNAPIIEEPAFISKTSYGNILAVMDSQNEKIYLFNTTGMLFSQRDFKANTGMAIGDPGNNRDLELITAHRNKLIVYSLK